MAENELFSNTRAYEQLFRYFSVLFMPWFMIIGVIGNVLVITAILTDKRLRNPTNFFLLSLAIPDLIVCLVVNPFSILQTFLGEWPLADSICIIFVFLDVLCCTCSIWHLVAISLYRLVGVTSPFRVRTGVYRYISPTSVIRITIITVWILSCAISSPVIILGATNALNVKIPIIKTNLTTNLLRRVNQSEIESDLSNDGIFTLIHLKQRRAFNKQFLPNSTLSVITSHSISTRSLSTINQIRIKHSVNTTQQVVLSESTSSKPILPINGYVKRHHMCGLNHKNFIIYGSVASFVVPLVLIVITYAVTIGHLLHSNRSKRLLANKQTKKKQRRKSEFFSLKKPNLALGANSSKLATPKKNLNCNSSSQRFPCEKYSTLQLTNQVSPSDHKTGSTLNRKRNQLKSKSDGAFNLCNAIVPVKQISEDVPESDAIESDIAINSNESSQNNYDNVIPMKMARTDSNRKKLFRRRLEKRKRKKNFQVISILGNNHCDSGDCKRNDSDQDQVTSGNPRNCSPYLRRASMNAICGTRTFHVPNILQINRLSSDFEDCDEDTEDDFIIQSIRYADNESKISLKDERQLRFCCLLIRYRKESISNSVNSFNEQKTPCQIRCKDNGKYVINRNSSLHTTKNNNNNENSNTGNYDNNLSHSTENKMSSYVNKSAGVSTEDVSSIISFPSLISIIEPCSNIAQHCGDSSDILRSIDLYCNAFINQRYQSSDDFPRNLVSSSISDNSRSIVWSKEDSSVHISKGDDHEKYRRPTSTTQRISNCLRNSYLSHFSVRKKESKLKTSRSFQEEAMYGKFDTISCKTTNNLLRQSRITLTNYRISVSPLPMRCKKSNNLQTMRKVQVKNQAKASKVLAIIVLTFVIAWFPFCVVNMMTAVEMPHDEEKMGNFNPSVSNQVITILTWLGYISSAINPIIYTIFNKRFRSVFANLLCCYQKKFL
ncbi:hypothetical protein SNEBB_008428 [Seison nebaliae]|nr:hypothetical protein SNEBB_008428 [Seison nebaliae]